MRVLGVDPGLRILGWGIVETNGSRLQHIANGHCKSQPNALAERLLTLHSQFTAVLEEFRPQAAAVEQTFVSKDAKATLKLGQARGIAMLVPAQFGLEVGEYAPNVIKRTVVGVGHADKKQIDHMVKMQLKGVEPVGPDAADALAVAICHAIHLQSTKSLANASKS